jgi:hypothetical protein
LDGNPSEGRAGAHGHYGHTFTGGYWTIGGQFFDSLKNGLVSKILTLLNNYKVYLNIGNLSHFL